MSLISFSPLIVEARGKSGTNIFKMIHSNPLMQKTFQRMTNNKFIDRNQRCLFVSLTKSWALLAQSDRDLWAALAVNINAGTIKYYGNKVSGFTLFLSYNFNMAALNLSYPIACPSFTDIYMPAISHLETPPPGPNFVLYLSVAKALDCSAIIQVSPNLSPGVANSNLFNKIDVVYAPVGDLSFDETINLTNHNPNWLTSNTKLFSRVRLVHQFYGFSSPWYYCNALIP